jgi:hypothetical protein
VEEKVKPISIMFVGTMVMADGEMTPLSMPFGMTFDTAVPVLIGSRPDRYPAIKLRLLPISRRHARLFYKEGGWYLWDLASENGTWLMLSEGQKLPEFEKPVIWHERFLLVSDPLRIEQEIEVLFGTLVAKINVLEE